MAIDNFDEGRKTCKMCLADKRTSYYKHHSKYNEAQRKKYKDDEEYRKKKKEQAHNYRNKIITCSACNCSISQGHYQEHNKTKMHQMNLEKPKKITILIFISGNKNRINE